MRNNLSTINVYKKKNRRSEIVTQLLYGDTFSIKKREKKWLKIENNVDNYKGYIINKKFPPALVFSHKVSSRSANLYSNPSNNKKIKKKLTFGSRMKIIEKTGSFYKFDKLWIKKNDVKTINNIDKNPFKGIKKFLNTRYMWGGKSYKGIDCSGLVQIFLNYNGKFCPRDAKDQMRYFKKKIKIQNTKKNDLIFWKGHVAIVTSKKTLIHAYGPLKKVTIMPIQSTIDRILKTANLKIISIKRI